MPWVLAFGLATTVGGGYLAARIAKNIPYYHGLGMGLLGIAYAFVLWPEQPDGYTWFGLLITIPAAIYGAHLAKLRMSANTG